MKGANKILLSNVYYQITLFVGFHLAEYPKDVIRASMGSPVVLTCVVHCSQSQSCRIEWLRAQTHSHVSQSRPNYIEVPSTYYGNKGLIYPTYTHNYTLTTTSMKIESKLVIQRLTPKYTGVYKCRAVRHHRAISSPNVSVELHAGMCIHIFEVVVCTVCKGHNLFYVSSYS